MNQLEELATGANWETAASLLRCVQCKGPVRFESPEALVKYLVKPSHQALGRLFWEYCDGTVVTEFESEDLRNVDADWFSV